MRRITHGRRSLPTSLRVLAAVTGLVLVGITGFVASGAFAGDAATSSATLSLRTTGLGRILVNSRGHTLYLFMKDRNGMSACAASCAKFWPPLLVSGKPTAGPGVRKALIGTTRRSSGRLQVTYNRHPLYTYAEDTRAGQTKGQRELAFGARWYAVSANGTAVRKTAPTTTGTTSNPYPTDPYPTDPYP